MDHFLMAYCGQVNKRLVQQLLACGVAAVGLSAMDCGMVRGRRRADLRVREGGRTLVLHGDHAGSIERIDTRLIDALLSAGTLPVICPPALGDDGVPINVDGDRLTAELAIALGAERMVIFSDANGFLADPLDRRPQPSPRPRSMTYRRLARLHGDARASRWPPSSGRCAAVSVASGSVPRGDAASAAARPGRRRAVGSASRNHWRGC